MAYTSNRFEQQKQDRRRGSYISRQNDPAYNREVQYTYSDHARNIYRMSNVREIVKMLCKDQGLNIPYIPETSHESAEFNVVILNERVEFFMGNATPLPKVQIKTE